jgi:hypothetical protein
LLFKFDLYRYATETNLAGWGGPGNGPNKACAPKYALHTTLVFYFNFDINAPENRQFETRLLKAAEPIKRRGGAS